jgi:hypothetical protein
MVNGIGIGASISILGAIAVLMLPVPLVLIRYGEPLRAKSHFAINDVTV